MTDRMPLDFDPPVRQLRALLLGVADDDLTAPTPCDGWSVGDLLDHLVTLTSAYLRAARKQPGATDTVPEPSAAHLPTQWRSRLAVLLEELATAWKDPAAWAGTAPWGGVTTPAPALATAAMNELTTHGWDLARATGQDFAADPRSLEALVGFLSPRRPDGSPVVPPTTADLEDEPTLLAKVVELTGRDPQWHPGTHHHGTRATRDAA
ncbi:TIGR03086 family metal-binding protein [Krasilnikovia sp. MM14-A1004]|uniref:TIGR03086 family metal-binding protein n=1 Tax=Krasilnikovia sp. MM14-A1004 TaxID=3373541 RepID=UPI00399D4D31